MKNCMKGLSVRKVENHCLKWESWVRWNKLQRNPEMLAQLPHSRSHTCSYSRLTPSSSSSELSKMLSKSCREGAKSVTCVRLPEPALPAALSCRTSVGKEARTQGEQAPQLGKRRTDMDWTSVNKVCWESPSYDLCKFRHNYFQICLSTLKRTEKQSTKNRKVEIKLLL